MMDRLEVKAAFEVGGAGEISGLVSVFGTADRMGDIVHKGAFAGARVPMPLLWAHDPEQVIGVVDTLTEGPDGLSFKGRLLISDIPRAAEVRAMVQSGAVSGVSFGYLATKKAPRRGGGRDLFQVELFEVSIVSVPMHPGTKITAVKALGAEKEDAMTLEELQAKMEVDAIARAAELAALEVKGAAAVAAAVAPLVARLAVFEAKGNRPAPGAGGDAEPSIERKAFAAYLTRGDLAGATELKALSVSSDPNGGYLAPPEFSSDVLKDIVEISPFRGLASVKGTNSPSVIYPTRKPGGNATWDDDTTAEPELTTTNIFGQLEILTKGMTSVIPIPNSLLQDAAAVEVEIREMAAEDFEKKETVAFTLGSGIYEPEGLLTNAEVPVFNYGAVAFAASDAVAPLITMLYSIAPSYRNKGAWMMNGTTLGKMRNWTDANGLKIWQPSLQVGQPETLLGRPVIENVDMPDVAAQSTPIIYGDFSGYRILDRLALSTLVDPYSEARLKRTLYHMGRRVGGRVMQPIKFKKLKMAV